MAYQEISGNIFNSKADALVNTVNCVGVMGKGIALEFKRRYPKMFEEYKNICQKNQLKPGQILPYRKQTPWVLNFAIKEHWKFPSKIEWIESCLDKFVKNYQAMGIKSVAFPWMGAMNGGIPLEQIKAITRRYLSHLPDISVEVYEFDKTAVDPLFKKLKDIAQIPDLDVQILSKTSMIQPRYLNEIIKAVRREKVKSLPLLIESEIVGETNIEKLYAFLREPALDIDKFHTKALLFH
jgi:O-acetyl-ADP-ribose deacetylase (regulator of RNase III)